MKAAVALLSSREVHNRVRKLAWEIQQEHRTGIDVCRLPPHVSLKQPFNVADLEGLGAYIAGLAGNLAPVRIELAHLDLIEAEVDGLASGILWLEVVETPTLRQLHERLNQELTARFGDVSALHDGAEYHFHMTVALGGQPVEVYREIFRAYAGRLANLEFTARELGLFVYDERWMANAGYMTYQTEEMKG